MIERRINSVGGNGVYPLDSDMVKAISSANMNPAAILKQAYEVSLKHSLWNVQSKRLDFDDGESEFAEDISDKIEYEVKESHPIEAIPRIENPVDEEPSYKTPITNEPRTIPMQQPSYAQKDIMSRPREEKEVKVKNIPNSGYNKPDDTPVDVHTKEFDEILNDIKL